MTNYEAEAAAEGMRSKRTPLSRVQYCALGPREIRFSKSSANFMMACCVGVRHLCWLLRNCTAELPSRI